MGTFTFLLATKPKGYLEIYLCVFASLQLIILTTLTCNMYHYANVKFLPLVAEMGNPLKKYPDKLNFPWQYADQYECWWSTIYSSISIPGYKYILMHWKNISSVQTKFSDNSRLKRSIKLWLLWRIFRLFFFHQKQCIALHCNVKEISAHRYLWSEKKKILEKVLWIITNKLDWNCLEEFFWHRSISQKDSLNVCSFFMWDIPKRISPTKKSTDFARLI